MKGYIQVYTGDGKGKTTAALGLALRAAGAGIHVYIAQFLKGRRSSEHTILEKLGDMITVRQFGRAGFMTGEPTEEDKKIARKGLGEIRKVLASGTYGLVILDEANDAVHTRLFPVEDLLDLLEKKPEEVEIVITGRNADPRIIERADLVTEMNMVKHYFERGVSARRGIED